MSKPIFTPGPWVVGDASECGQYVWDPKGERIVAETYPDENQDFEENAKLIAAAPDMYEALEFLLQERLEIGGSTLSLRAFEKIKSATRKARGET